MPELPEVETMRRGVLPIVGSRIREIDFVRSRFKKILIQPRQSAFRRRAIGQMIVEIRRLGKRVLLQLESDDAIVIEPRMTGLLLLRDPPDQEHLRMAFRLNGGIPVLWFWDRRGLGTVRLMSAKIRAARLGPQQLGPDALEVDTDVLRERFHRSRRAIKVALLDQRSLSGIGNLYASELLHVARVHPESRCDQLSQRQWTAIQRAMRKVLLEAIDHEGSTLSDGTYRNALNQQGSYQDCHRVYGKSDQLCARCRTARIQRIVQSQRSTFYCPRCQPKT